MTFLPAKRAVSTFFVRRHDDAVGVGDFLCGQAILDAAAAVGLHLDGDAQLGTGLFQCLRRHVGVGDAGRAGGDRQHLEAFLLRSSSCSNRSSCFLRIFFLFKAVDGRNQFLRALCAAQCCDKRRVHQQHHQVGEDLQVQVTVHGAAIMKNRSDGWPSIAP